MEIQFRSGREIFTEARRLMGTLTMDQLKSGEGAKQNHQAFPEEEPVRLSPQAQAVFADLYQHSYDLAYNIAYNFTQDPDKASDLAHLAFQKLMERYPDVNKIDNPTGLLRRTVTRTALDALREQNKRKLTSWDNLPFEPVTVRSLPEDPALQREEQQKVWDTLTKMNHPYAKALVLRYIFGLPPKEVAALLDMEPGVFEPFQYRAHGQFKKLYQQPGTEAA